VPAFPDPDAIIRRAKLGHHLESLMRRLCILIALVFLVSACGQKGPLYLPKDGDKPKKHEPRKTEEGTIEK
jgi:predicted small lipoprotein YifL